MSNYLPLDVSFATGSGCYLFDKNGDKYLDALSGVGVVNLGHTHPEITKTIQQQAEKLLHTSNWYRIDNQEVLAKQLCDLAQMDNAFFANSGAEANEAAIKIARLHGQNKAIDTPTIITANRSFHGRTMAALSATGNEKVQAGFAPLVEKFIHVDFNDVNAIAAHSDNPNIVAVMLEPIQGESGVIIPDAKYLNQVQEICQANDWLLILDEVQTGIGRTGKYFAHQHNQIIPDVLTLAKGLGNGVPIGACLAKGKASKLFTPGTHGSTFGGNPLVCAVASKVLEVMDKDQVLDNANTIGTYLKTALTEALKDSDNVLEIRQQGMMIAIELTTDTSNLLQQALADKLLINITGQSIRLLPPLIMTQAEAEILISKITQLVNNAR